MDSHFLFDCFSQQDSNTMGGVFLLYRFSLITSLPLTIKQLIDSPAHSSLSLSHPLHLCILHSHLQHRVVIHCAISTQIYSHCFNNYFHGFIILNSLALVISCNDF